VSVARTNLLELASRPGRFEHHLTVVARIGEAQLEIATASEPLYFAHVNVSDEYALALPTGDPLVDGFPLRTFVSDAATGEDVARYNHRVGDLVLHPLGAMHWPGRLRPPYAPIVPPPGMRRCGTSLVFCACAPTPAAGAGRTVSAGREADAKAYVATPPPLALLDTLREDSRMLARVGHAGLRLMVAPSIIAAPRGAYVVVLAAESAAAHRACDLIHLPPAASLDAAGIERAFVLESEMQEASPPPQSWHRIPDVAIEPFESGPRHTLPLSRAGIAAVGGDATEVTIRVRASTAHVPRYWLARTLFRIAIHRPLLGYVETYGGFFFDDRRQASEGITIGLRAGDRVTLPAPEALSIVEALYRAVAPPGYAEQLTAQASA
jgi:hypothetical protein